MKELKIKVGDTVRTYNLLATYGRSYLVAERKEGYSENSGSGRFLVPIKGLIGQEDGTFVVADWFKRVADAAQVNGLHLNF